MFRSFGWECFILGVYWYFSVIVYICFSCSFCNFWQGLHLPHETTYYLHYWTVWSTTDSLTVGWSQGIFPSIVFGQHFLSCNNYQSSGRKPFPLHYFCVFCSGYMWAWEKKSYLLFSSSSIFLDAGNDHSVLFSPTVLSLPSYGGAIQK